MNQETSVDCRGRWIDGALTRFRSGLRLFYSDSEFSIGYGSSFDQATMVVECRRLGGHTGSADIDLVGLRDAGSERDALDILYAAARLAWERASGGPRPRRFRFQRRNPKHLSGSGDGVQYEIALSAASADRLADGIRHAARAPGFGRQ